ncbi:MAG: hypothetical protein M0R46_01630 [Candidatus Muirbacterium halophilum]|nr:hypothetical protein [Candidatus Muirbacterium halophilum]MCK9474596.1 hypothetical protein [Candidatus Muirbacterium halophilum]
MISIIIAGGKIKKNILNSLIKQSLEIKNSEILLVSEKEHNNENIYNIKLSKDHGFSKMAMFGALFSQNPYIIFFRNVNNISSDYIKTTLRQINKNTFAVTFNSTLYKKLLLNPSGTLFRKDLFFKLGGFSPDIRNTILSTIQLSQKIKKNKIPIIDSKKLIISSNYKKGHLFFYNLDLIKVKLKHSKKRKINIYANIARDIFIGKKSFFEKSGIIYGITRYGAIK